MLQKYLTSSLKNKIKIGTMAAFLLFSTTGCKKDKNESVVKSEVIEGNNIENEIIEKENTG